MLRDDEDAFGSAMYDFWQGKPAYEIIERDDGFFSVSPGPGMYFTKYEEWCPVEQMAIDRARGRVLDIGCGAGRHALYLQGSGLEVVGVDNSPLAVRTSRERGVREVHLMSIQQVNPKRLGVFDTILMMGNNFALLGKPDEMKRHLERFHRMTPPGGLIIAQNRDPYDTDLLEHQEYHARNHHMGRMPGQARIRVRYKRIVTPWIDFLMLSPNELGLLLEGTGWKIEEWLAAESGNYIAFLIKE